MKQALVPQTNFEQTAKGALLKRRLANFDNFLTPLPPLSHTSTLSLVPCCHKIPYPLMPSSFMNSP